MRLSRIWIVMAAALALGCSDDGSGGNGDAGADTGADSDSDTDTDADADAGEDGGTTADAPLVGLYAVAGTGSGYGAYEGYAEIREADAGLEVSHIQTWTDADFEGDLMALAWAGAVTSDEAPYGIAVTLDRVGFITSYGGVTRDTDAAANSPIDFSASLVRTGPTVLHGTFVPSDSDGAFAFTETWTRLGDPGEAPLWRNERVVVDGHDPIGDSTKETLFTTYATFHALPAVAPYVERPEFQAAMHTWIFDPTDFQFSRDNPGTVRVIQKVVDAVSLAEARIRNRAYAQTLAEKQAVFEPLVPENHLSETGMICYHDPSLPDGEDQEPDGDSMLWTGVYAASQALRYLETGDADAYANMLEAIEGQLLCHDIAAATPGDFARTTRPHLTPLGDWNQGTGEHAGYDWLPGANNDMMKGYVVGFSWAFQAIEQAGGDDALVNRMVAVLDDLLDNNDPVDTGSGDITNSMSRGTLDLMQYMMTGDLDTYADYLTCYPAIQTWMVDMGNGAFYEYGTSDWSGNHLVIQGLLTLYATAGFAAGPLNSLDSHADAYADGLAQALDNLKHTRLGLYQLVAAGLGDFAAAQPELEEARWTLREFPAPKESYAIDFRINPSFCMSPIPNLPWKGDWTTTDRTQSISVPPLFERPVDNYRWKSGAGTYKGSIETYDNPGVDYLFAYWFARHYDLVGDSD